MAFNLFKRNYSNVKLVKVISGSSNMVDKLNSSIFKVNLSMSLDIYYTLIENGFKPSAFMENNDVKIYILLDNFSDFNEFDIKERIVSYDQVVFKNERDLLGELVDSDKYKDFLEQLNDPDFSITKPIRTQSELDEERLAEIVDGIVRYSKQKMAIPTEWIEEYNSIIERERNKPNSK